MKQLFNKNKYFLIPYLIFLVFSFIIIILYSKAEIHIFINTYHNSISDFFFKYFTNVGDGIVPVFIIILFIFVRYRYAIIHAIGAFSAGLFAQMLKRFIFSDHPRPKNFFENIYQEEYSLYLASGVDPANHFSFPSGHSATGFAIFFFFALISKNKAIKGLMFILALLTAYSRVYLSWHFLEDTVAGSFIGVFTVFLTYFYFMKIKNKWIDKKLVLRKRNFTKED